MSATKMQMDLYDADDDQPPTKRTPVSEPPPKQRRGFACMDRARVVEIASKGGKAAHAAGTGHRFTREEAIEAGRKGGLAPKRKRAA